MTAPTMRFELAWQLPSIRRGPFIKITGPFGEHALDTPSFPTLRAARRWTDRQARTWRGRGWDVTWEWKEPDDEAMGRIELTPRLPAGDPSNSPPASVVPGSVRPSPPR